MGGGKKSKKDKDKKSRKTGRESSSAAVSREVSDDESYFDDNSDGPDGPDSMVPQASKVDIEKKAEQATMEDEFGAKDFRNQMELRTDHESRPLWIAPNGHIFLETFSPVYRQSHFI